MKPLCVAQDLQTLPNVQKSPDATSRQMAKERDMLIQGLLVKSTVAKKHEGLKLHVLNSGDFLCGHGLRGVMFPDEGHNAMFCRLPNPSVKHPLTLTAIRSRDCEAEAFPLLWSPCSEWLWGWGGTLQWSLGTCKNVAFWPPSRNATVWKNMGGIQWYSTQCAFHKFTWITSLLDISECHSSKGSAAGLNGPTAHLWQRCPSVKALLWINAGLGLHSHSRSSYFMFTCCIPDMPRLSHALSQTWTANNMINDKTKNLRQWFSTIFATCWETNPPLRHRAQNDAK